MNKSRIKNRKAAFTLIECLIVVALLSAFFFSFRNINQLYAGIVAAASADHVAAACHYLAHCAQVRAVPTSLHITGSDSYTLDDGNMVTAYRLPGGVSWGVAGEVYGPPLLPTRLVTSCVVGGEHEEGGVRLRWAESGAHTPGTIYLHLKDNCFAVTLPRAVDGAAHVYRHCAGKWVMRTC